MPIKDEVARMKVMSSRLTRHWGKSMAVYGAVAAMVGLYMTDWKVTNDKIPFYGKKFDDDSNL